MKDKHLKVKGIEYKIVDESWTDHAAEVRHRDYVVYRLDAGKWRRLHAPNCYETDYHQAESSIPGLYAQKRCPTCGHSHTVRTVPY